MSQAWPAARAEDFPGHEPTGKEGVLERIPDPAGVVGMFVRTSDDSGIGVVGVADPGIGIMGIGDQGEGVVAQANKGWPAIRAEADLGEAIRAHSERGRGGVFRSGGVDGLIGQVQLTPQEMAIGGSEPASPEMQSASDVASLLPSRGDAGDLLTTIDPGTGTCTLWLCVRSGNPGLGIDPASWAQVLLGGSIQGQS